MHTLHACYGVLFNICVKSPVCWVTFPGAHWRLAKMSQTHKHFFCLTCSALYIPVKKQFIQYNLQFVSPFNRSFEFILSMKGLEYWPCIQAIKDSFFPHPLLRTHCFSKFKHLTNMLIHLMNDQPSLSSSQKKSISRPIRICWIHWEKVHHTL